MTYDEVFYKFLEWRSAYKAFYGSYPKSVWILSEEEEKGLK